MLEEDCGCSLSNYPLCSRRNQAKINLACLAGVERGRERGFWAQEKRGVCARREREWNMFWRLTNQDFNVSQVDVPSVFLAPKIPFPFSFKRLPRKLRSTWSYVRYIGFLSNFLFILKYFFLLLRVSTVMPLITWSIWLLLKKNRAIISVQLAVLFHLLPLIYGTICPFTSFFRTINFERFKSLLKKHLFRLAFDM